jgi:spermidine/putrescine transport system permease protein
MRRRDWGEWALSAPSLGWLLLFFAAPTLLIFAIAFHPADALGGIGRGWTLANWRHLSNPNYPAIVWRTLWISLATTALCVLLALPCAYAMARAPLRWRGLLAGLVILPFWTSFLIRVFAWRVLLHPEGALKHVLVVCGVASDDTLLLYNSGAILLVSVYSFLPFAILPLYAAAEKFDFALIEAARDLGARSLRAFVSVFVPGIRRGLVSAVLMVFIPALGSYVIPDLVGGPDSELIGNKIAQRTFADRNLPHASALSALLTIGVLLPLALLVLVWRRQGEHLAGAATDRGGAR